MEQVPIRELNQNTAGVLARVERGESVEITNRGKPIARLVPVGGGELDDLIAAGRVLPATRPGLFLVPEGEVEPGADAAALVRRLRDEERT